MKHLTRLCALLLCAAVTLSLAGCLSRDQVMGVVAPTEAPEEEPAGPVGERLTEEESDERGGDEQDAANPEDDLVRAGVRLQHGVELVDDVRAHVVAGLHHRADLVTVMKNALTKF